jgi:bifunctional enzyme CysN/CysC
MSVIETKVRQAALPIVIVGHVDHGKSTLIGRLLHDTDSLPDGKVEQLRAMAERRGMPFEWSFVMDALQIERDQGITVDMTQIWFHTAKRRFVIIDAPGHKTFLKNMVTGAASADGAVLVVDALQGLSEQTRRHAYLLHLLGLRQVAVAINKMDLVDYRADRFAEVAEALRSYLNEIGVEPQAIVPISARQGDNIVLRGTNTPWYTGPVIVGVLEGFAPGASPVERPLRLPVQDVYRHADQRIIVGRIESGRIKVGDRLRFAPNGQTGRVATIESWNPPVPQVAAMAGQCVAFTIDDDIFVERGQIATAPEAAPAEGHAFVAQLFWLGRDPLEVGRRLKLRLATGEHDVTIDRIGHVVDVIDLKHRIATRIECNGVAEVTFRSRAKIAFDTFADNPRTGRAVLAEGHRLVGGCIIERIAESSADRNLTTVPSTVEAAQRALANGHGSGVLWLTGLSGSGKSTLAMAVQKRLFERGWQVAVLDGDNLRQGLSQDLAFSPEDRSENIRRVAEVARLFADNGFIVMVALISPFQVDRAGARDIVGSGFHEVYLKADLATCRRRDPKGLYAKAKAGEISGFTGIAAPYETPEAPTLVIDTAIESQERSVVKLIDYADNAFCLPQSRSRAAG